MTEQEAINHFVAKVKKYYSMPRYTERRDPPHTLISHLFWVLDTFAKEAISDSEVESVIKTQADYNK